jgi:hypothetical protein
MQRLGQALVFLLVFVGVGLGCYFLLAPHVVPPASGPNAPVPPPAAESMPAPTSATGTSPVLPAARIAPPRSATQREADDIEARRAPDSQWLRSKFGDTLAGEQSSSSDQATLDLYTNRSDSTLVLTLLGQAVQPYADQYGFNHVRFFMPNPTGSVEQYRFAAEASPSPDGSWKAFEK